MRLGMVLRKWRKMSEMDMRTAAKLMDLDHVTYFRLEQGRMPSAETLRKVLAFLMSDKEKK